MKLPKAVAIPAPGGLPQRPGAQVRIVAVEEEHGHRFLVGQREELVDELECRLVGEVQVFEH